MTDEGIHDISRGLEEALIQAQHEGRPTLNILKLSGNTLTCDSLYEISASVRLAAEEIQEIDLSNNEISVTTVEDAKQFSAFLQTLRHCKALKIINLSGNNLSGSLAWEAFARTYAAHFTDNKDVLDRLADDFDGTDMNKISGGLTNLEIQRRDSAHEDSLQHGSLVVGLPSIATFNIGNVNLTDSGALWLSSCIGKHNWVQDRLRQSQYNQHLAPVHSGFTLLPNDKLSSTGLKLLKQAETTAYDPLARPIFVPDSSPMAHSAVHDALGLR